MPIDTKALYYVSDLADRAERRLGLVEQMLEVSFAQALIDGRKMRDDGLGVLAYLAPPSDEEIARLSSLYPHVELAEVWNLKKDFEGMEYGFVQAQMTATGLQPWQWSPNDPAAAGILNVRAFLNGLVNRADAILRRHSYVERDARHPYYEWNLEEVRKQTVEAFQESAQEVLVPKGGWKLETKLAVLGAVAAVVGLLWKR